MSLSFYFGPNQEKVTKIIEDGVEIVVNYLEPYKIEGEPNTLILKEEFNIDFEREDLGKIGITEVLMFDADSEGNLYLRISRSSQDLIYKFDEKGNFLSSFGRKGQGPGELVSPKSLRVNTMDQIEISDSHRKLYLFEKNGVLIREISLSQGYMMATILENGKILAMKSYFNQEEGRNRFPIVLCDEHLEETKILHPGRGFSHLRIAKKINPLEYYADYYTYRTLNGLVYVGNYGSGYEFLIYDTEGNLIRKIRKEYKKVEVPKQLKEEILSKGEKYNLNDVIKKVYFPEFYPPFQFFFLDEKGRLYVMTHEKGKSTNSFIYDIFNPNGLFIGRIELENFGFSPFAIHELPLPLNVISKNNRIYSLREKENGFQELVIYKMKWE